MGWDEVPHTVLFCTEDNGTADRVRRIIVTKCIGLNVGNEGSLFKASKYPWFDKENNFMCRALTACTIVNEDWKGGQIGVGSTSV